MKKLKTIGVALLLGFGTMTMINSCNDDDPDPNGNCDGNYTEQQECLDAIQSVNDCRCEFENGVWKAVPDN